jgi:twitching motility protein PilT
MCTFDQHIISLYEQGFISQETAQAYSSRRGIVNRGIDSVKSSRGEATTDIDHLELDHSYGKLG